MFFLLIYVANEPAKGLLADIWPTFTEMTATFLKNISLESPEKNIFWHLWGF